MIDRSKALQNLPQALRDELFDDLDRITRNYRENRWEASELDGGRFREVAYAILVGYFTGTYPATAAKPANMKSACDALSANSTHGGGDDRAHVLSPISTPALLMSSHGG
jgi:hypothetical protein